MTQRFSVIHVVNPETPNSGSATFSFLINWCNFLSPWKLPERFPRPPCFPDLPEGLQGLVILPLEAHGLLGQMSSPSSGFQSHRTIGTSVDTHTAALWAIPEAAGTCCGSRGEGTDCAQGAQRCWGFITRDRRHTLVSRAGGRARLSSLQDTGDPSVTSWGIGIPTTHREVLEDYTREEEELRFWRFCSA